MDINEWEYYVLCSRLKTKRQKERLRKWDSDKKLIKINKELKRLQKEQMNLGHKELDPPVQRGWKRSFVLRPDVERTKDRAFFQALLDKINTEQYSHRRDFKKKIRKKGKKIHVPRVQKLNEFYEWSFRKLKLTEKEKLYFIEKWEFNQKRELCKKYAFAEPWRYTLRVRPNMITKVKVIDPLLLQQQAEIDNFLCRNNLWPRLHKVVDGWHQYRWNPGPKEKYKQLLKTDSIKNLMEDYYKEKQHEH
ncbi:hypothetical protein CNR22_23125 [Sphingobacteriaceae bacterium]|nr:hypothetical protein CNR22_23125 [Sphingobacteriaceae bacterium]